MRLIALLLVYALILQKASAQSSNSNGNNDNKDPYLSVLSLGNGVLQITNHQPCAVDIEIKAFNPGVIKTISPNNKNSLTFVQIPSGVSNIQITGEDLTKLSVKVLSVCEYKGRGPIHIDIDLNLDRLPVRFRNMRGIMTAKMPTIH